MAGRELSVKLTPRPGEVLESWLGAIAEQLDAPFGDFLRFVGSSSGVDLSRSGLSVYLSEQEVTALSVSTGVEPETIRGMTLARYDGHLVSIDRSAERLLWSAWMPSRTRFCSECLKASGGAWQLRWRLPWCFICDVHQCLLQDFCPECAQPQRVSRRWLSFARVPSLQRCSMSKDRLPCLGNLTTITQAALDEGDPLVTAHRQLSAVLTDLSTTFGVYALSPASSLQVLADLRLLGSRMLAAADAETVDRVLNLDDRHPIGARLSAQGMRPRDWGAALAFSSCAPATITGAGIALALMVLGSGSIREAGDRLRRVVGPGRRLTQAPPGNLRHSYMSPAAEAVHLRAISDRFTRTAQLRYRTESSLPRYPRDDGLGVENVPSAMWPEWCLRLSAKQRTHVANMRASLATLLLIVGTRMPVDEACRLLGGHVTAIQHHAFLRDMRTNLWWPNFAEAIIGLTDYLLLNGSPINYQRRRDLSYEKLLPIDRWADICAHAGLAIAVERSWQLTRSWLFERVSGQPGYASPFPSGLRRADFYRARLVEGFTADVMAMLDGEATRFLHCHRIFDEPVWWSPPLNIVGDLQLPGPDVSAVSVAALHEALDDEAMTVPDIARSLGLSVACVQLALERSPRKTSGTTSVVPRMKQADRLKNQLSPTMFARLHGHDGLTINAIATRYGVTRKAVETVAREYHIEVKHVESRPQLNADPAWFRREYVEKCRTLTDIANEIGTSVWVLSRFARRHGIPVVRSFRSRPA